MHTVWTVVALGYISLQALFWPESQCFFGGGFSVFPVRVKTPVG